MLLSTVVFFWRRKRNEKESPRHLSECSLMDELLSPHPEDYILVKELHGTSEYASTIWLGG